MNAQAGPASGIGPPRASPSASRRRSAQGWAEWSWRLGKSIRVVEMPIQQLERLCTISMKPGPVVQTLQLNRRLIYEACN